MWELYKTTKEQLKERLFKQTISQFTIILNIQKILSDLMSGQTICYYCRGRRCVLSVGCRTSLPALSCRPVQKSRQSASTGHFSPTVFAISRTTTKNRPGLQQWGTTNRTQQHCIAIYTMSGMVKIQAWFEEMLPFGLSSTPSLLWRNASRTWSSLETIGICSCFLLFVLFV